MTVRHQNRRLQHLTIEAALVTLIGCFLARPAAAADEPRNSRVRSSDRSIIALIDRATAESPTFRLLRTRFEASDGIVYIEPGHCGHGVRACLIMWVGVSGPNRFLRILVDRRKADSDVDFMGTIGHELQHALESLSERAVTDGHTLYHFFGRYAPTDGNRFETAAAIDVGEAVRLELRVH